MRTVTGLPTLVAAAMVAMIAGGQWIRSGAVAAPAEGLTPFGFFMARGYGEPAVHPAMRFIAFKPSDGAKFRESFEKKHGPKGRDLIDSLGKGSYKTAAAGHNGEVVIAGDGPSSSKPLVVKNIQEPSRTKKRYEKIEKLNFR